LKGGRPVFAGAAASSGVVSVLAESVSMSDSQSGAKNFRVATSLGACLRWYTLHSLKFGQSHLCCAACASGHL
jgi:hypothetical protein